MISIEVYKESMKGPEDISGLKRLVETNVIDPKNLVAILGKTEGNGCVNDFTRGYSNQSLIHYLTSVTGLSPAEIIEQTALVMSGGTEGVMTPHFTFFTREDIEGEELAEKSLVVSSGFTREFLPEEQGTLAMVEEVKRVVLELMKQSGISDPNDVHFVQIKCPLLTSDRIQDAHQRGFDTVTHDTYESMGFNRGASALGVAIALGEIQADQVTNEVICKDWNLYSDVASTSAGIELLNCEIVLMGNSKKGNGKYFIGHDVMKDSIDIEAVLRACKSAGLVFDEFPSESEVKKIVNVFAKAEAASTGLCRNRRTTMLTDSDINHTRHARAVVNGVIASVLRDPMIYVSGGSEHQGPDGGGPISVVIKK